MQTKVCSRKDECINPDGPDQPISGFNKEAKSSDGFQSRCRLCQKAHSKKHRSDNSEYHKNRCAQWNAANPENIIKHRKTYYTNNKNKISKRGKQYYADNRNERLAINKKYRVANKDKLSEYSKQWYIENREESSKLSKIYYADNRDKILNVCKKYRDENKQEIALYSKQWRARNRGAMQAYSAKRRAAQLQRTVGWSDQWRMEQYYIIARKLEDIYEIDFHVDHKIPLRGKNVSGLHVHNNLQIITATENLAKGNKFTPIMGII